MSVMRLVLYPYTKLEVHRSSGSELRLIFVHSVKRTVDHLDLSTSNWVTGPPFHGVPSR